MNPIYIIVIREQDSGVCSEIPYIKVGHPLVYSPYLS